MTKTLNESVLESVSSSGLVDYDQRSAIGMARSWLDQGEIKLAGPGLEALYRGRDALAVKLVEIIRGVDRDDAMSALSKARAVINEPYLDTSMVGWRANRLKAGLVGSEKKNSGRTPARGGVAG